MSQIFYHFDGIEVSLGQTHPEVDHWLGKYQKHRWVILTAENPNGEQFPIFINKQRTSVLRDELHSSFYPFVEGKGVAEGYPEEVSFLILGIELDDAFEMAIRYDQKAVITGVLGGFSEVIRLEE